jgi:hypothetical protein
MLALAMMPALGAPAFATDLLTIYREAVVQDSTYAGAKAQYIGAQEKLPQARAHAEPQVSAAERDLAQAVYGTIVNQLKLKAAVGKLAEADLADVNVLLKEEAP